MIIFILNKSYIYLIYNFFYNINFENKKNFFFISQ